MTGYAPHPHVGGRGAVLQLLAAWRMAWPGTPRVIVITGAPGSGRSRLVAGFLMLCDPRARARLPLGDMDPSAVPPEGPAPLVADPRGRTAGAVMRLIAEALEPGTPAGPDGAPAGEAGTEDLLAAVARTGEPVSVVVPDVDLAGPLRTVDGPARLVREVLGPLARTGTVQLLADVPRPLVGALTDGLPVGSFLVVDLDDPQWADPEGLVRQAEHALDPDTGAPPLPFTTDPHARRELARAVADRAAGNRLTAHLAVHSILMCPEGFDPADPGQLPRDVAEAVDLHARRLGADPALLRQALTPLAFAEGDGLPFKLWGRLASAAAGRDLRPTVTGAPELTGPFIDSAEDEDGRTLLRLLHPAIGDAVRAAAGDPAPVQRAITEALLDTVPARSSGTGRDWTGATAYARDLIAGHALQAGLLPRLLDDPGLVVAADPVALHAAAEAAAGAAAGHTAGHTVGSGAQGTEPGSGLTPAGRTYLRTAPLLVRLRAAPRERAALLESAYTEDTLTEHATAMHHLGFDLPWRTAWSLDFPGIGAAAVGTLPAGAGGPQPVAVLTVPAGTPGARPLGGEAALVYGLHSPTWYDVDPAAVERPTEEARAAAPCVLERDADRLRVRERATGRVAAVLVPDSPLTGADLAADGTLLVATARGAKVLQIRPPAPPLPHQAGHPADDRADDPADDRDDRPAGRPVPH
ncbi:ATP-binding protein [Streptomyces thermolineatus]|uniref:ATP-binding protein n=1 Tax=Streptomyces thermolineatus TaxID=44033 RepID=UPI00384FA027